MSRNIRSLNESKGVDKPLLGELMRTGKERGLSPEAIDDLAQEYRVGEATVLGTASFYDFLGDDQTVKRAYACSGTACLVAGTQDDVAEELQGALSPDEIGSIACLGRCHENRAFQIGGRNYSGNDLDHLDEILNDPRANSGESYHVESLCVPPELTAPFPGVEALYRPLMERLAKGPDALLEDVKSSGLRGRGGAGFPTAVKWDAARQAPGVKKYIICNADEGDPGAYIDRYLLEHQPHLILFGMLVAGFIVGANDGILYIRAEYPDSIAAIKKAVAEAEAAGCAGSQIGGTDFSFQFTVVSGAGAYICGEETALIASLEGRRPEVSIRPPFPTTEGLFGKPTVVNNVETLANLYPILSKGGAAFSRIGTTQSSGPKLVSLNGVFKRPGLFEVPMGTPLSVVINNLGQGFREPVKAAQVGGPLGGVVPRDRLDALTLDFESFQDAGFLLGHGSIVAIPTRFPMMEYMEHLFAFCAEESCGKCFPCRLGATRGAEMLRAAIRKERIIDRALLDDLLETMELGSLCAHGGGIPLPIRNILQYFAEELEAYIA